MHEEYWIFHGYFSVRPPCFAIALIVMLVNKLKMAVNALQQHPKSRNGRSTKLSYNQLFA